MKITYLRLNELIIPLSLLAFIGSGIVFARSIFTGGTRWLFLLLLTFFLLVYRQRDVIRVVRHPLFWVMLLHAGWALITVVWSEVPKISLAKSIAFIWVSNILLISGYSWVVHHKREQTCDFLWLFAVVSFLASPFGQTEINMDVGSIVYAGLTGNPNFLGFILAVTTVLLIWRAYLIRTQNSWQFVLYLVLIAFALYYLILSHSRASLLVFILVLVGLLIGVGKLKKRWPYIIILTGGLLATYQFSSAVSGAVKQYIFKSSLTYMQDMKGEATVWFSREEAWEESYNRAILAGNFGAGYGVTMGEAFHGELGTSISSGKYGREQGNSQLAIMEQMGVVGLGLYFLLISYIFRLFFSGLRCALFKRDKVVIGLLGGAIFGLLVQSCFEAWWVAPGAPESGVFWMLLGALVGAVRRARLSARQFRLLRQQDLMEGKT